VRISAEACITITDSRAGGADGENGPGNKEQLVEVVLIRWDLGTQHVEVLNIGTILVVGLWQFNVSDQMYSNKFVLL
jgi:hypothetical protein